MTGTRSKQPMAVTDSALKTLLAEVRCCELCPQLPLGPKPLLQCSSAARILIAGQAPGRRAHESGIPFDDRSGQRLREWMGVDRDVFYDPGRVAILPMGFCYPGSSRSGDLPPRPECAAEWRRALLEQLPGIRLTLVIGSHAQRWHLDGQGSGNVTETVRNWQDWWPSILPLPHPSPRNNRWLRRNPFFESDVLPVLKRRVHRLTGV